MHSAGGWPFISPREEERPLSSLRTIAAAALLAAVPAGATEGGSPYPPDSVLRRLAHHAERIVLGRCVALETEATLGGPAEVVTATFQLDRTLLGPPGDRLTLRYYRPGPSAGRSAPGTATPEERAAYGLRDDTAPEVHRGDADGAERSHPHRTTPPGVLARGVVPIRFHPGEEVLLFLPALSPDGFLRTRDPGFAKLSVVRLGPRGVRVAIASAGPPRLTALPVAPPREEHPLATLLERIEAMVHRSGAPAAEGRP